MKNVTKMDLSLKIAQKLNNKLPATEIRDIIDIFVDELLGTLAEDRRIEIRGFGCFQARIRKAKIGRNPRTGVKVEVPEHKTPTFKFSKDAVKTYKLKLLSS